MRSLHPTIGSLTVLTLIAGSATLVTAQSTAPLAPSPTALIEPGPTQESIDASTWTPYASDRYGFSIGHPADWTERPADHTWVFPADHDWLSPATEMFKAPGDAVLVTAWSVPIEPGTTADAWLTAYCQLVTGPCTGLDGSNRRGDRGRPPRLAGAVRRRHPGLHPRRRPDVHHRRLGERDRDRGRAIRRCHMSPGWFRLDHAPAARRACGRHPEPGQAVANLLTWNRARAGHHRAVRSRRVVPSVVPVSSGSSRSALGTDARGPGRRDPDDPARWWVGHRREADVRAEMDPCEPPSRSPAPPSVRRARP